MSSDPFMNAAIEEAKLGLEEGGIPIGSVLVLDGEIVGRGHNRRVQKGSAILHAEMDCLENAGRLKAKDYQRCVLYSTLSPCDMCSGTALIKKITESEEKEKPALYVISGRSGSSQEEKAALSQTDGHIKKPFDNTRLIEALQKANRKKA